MREADIKDFWQHHPCGDVQVGGLHGFRNDYEAFFREYDTHRYNKESHILRRLDEIDFRQKRTLEVGLGQGADAEQLIRRGARWSGIDLTRESVDRVQVRLKLRELPYEEIKHGSVLALPFKDDSFDIVFSHGVLHHVPDIATAQREIWRVLKPDGKLVIMVYAKYSLNYLLSIFLLRRMGLVVLYSLRYSSDNLYGQHVRYAREVGLRKYLAMSNFIHRNTDTPGNPYSKVYDSKSLKQDFSCFRLARLDKCFMHAPPLPVRWIPGERLLGWHLWAQLEPVSSQDIESHTD